MLRKAPRSQSPWGQPGKDWDRKEYQIDKVEALIRAYDQLGLHA